MTILAHTEMVPGAIVLGETRSRLVIRNDDGCRLGMLRNRRRDGWRFYPEYQRAPSRKGWPTVSQALKSYGIRLAPPPDIAERIGKATTAFKRLGAALATIEA